MSIAVEPLCMKICACIISTASVYEYLTCTNTGLSALQASSNSILLTNLLGRYYYLHFRHAEVKYVAQRHTAINYLCPSPERLGMECLLITTLLCCLQIACILLCLWGFLNGFLFFSGAWISSSVEQQPVLFLFPCKSLNTNNYSI